LQISSQFDSIRSKHSLVLAKLKSEALQLSVFPDAGVDQAALDGAETKLSSASELANEGQWNGAFGLLLEANRTIGTAAESVRGAELEQLRKFNLLMQNSSAPTANSSAIIAELTKATSFTVADSQVKKASLDLGIDTATLQKQGASDQKDAAALAKKLDPAKPSTIAENAAALRDMEARMVSGGSSDAIFQALASLRDRATRSLETARLALGQLTELAPKDDKQLSDEQSYLQSRLGESQTALDDGRLLDSISLSSHVQARVMTALQHLPQKGGASAPGQGIRGSDFGIIALSILFIAGLVVMIARRRSGSEGPQEKTKIMNAEEERSAQDGMP
jgi:hypothetical protein